jgi:hypothetical protein
MRAKNATEVRICYGVDMIAPGGRNCDDPGQIGGEEQWK